MSIIVAGTAIATLLAARELMLRSRTILGGGGVGASGGDLTDGYRRYRQRVGRAILLGLEVLVAADIVRTVAVEPTLRQVGVLAGIVVIRTILSFSLEVELEGQWPWQRQSE